jgi:cytochrome c-type biogenesis protein CcmH
VNWRGGNGAAQTLKPQLKQSFEGKNLGTRAQVINRWNGLFSVQAASYSPASGCVVLDLKWHPFGNWSVWALIVAGIGGLVLLVAGRQLGSPTVNAVIVSLLIGLAGAYFLGKKPPASKAPYPQAPLLIKARQSLNQGVVPTNRWQIIADAMTRHGQFAGAAEVLTGAIQDDPRNAEAWLAMGDVIFAHKDGAMSQASEFAYDQADRLSGQPDYVATAMDRSQRAEIAAIWRKRQALLNSQATLSNRPSSATDAP